MSGSGQVWRVCNFMTQTQPNPTCYKKKFVTQPDLPSPKNRPNQAGWVGSGRVWKVGGFSAHPCLFLTKFIDQKMIRKSCEKSALDVSLSIAS